MSASRAAIVVAMLVAVGPALAAEPPKPKIAPKISSDAALLDLWRAAKADGWLYLSVNDEVVVGTRPVTSAGQKQRIWVRYDRVRPSPERGIGVRTEVVFLEVDCGDRSTTTLSTTLYEGPGMVGQSRTIPRSYVPDYAIPGTFAEAALERACSPADDSDIFR